MDTNDASRHWLRQCVGIDEYKADILVPLFACTGPRSPAPPRPTPFCAAGVDKPPPTPHLHTSPPLLLQFHELIMFSRGIYSKLEIESNSRAQ